MVSARPAEIATEGGHCGHATLAVGGRKAAVEQAPRPLVSDISTATKLVGLPGCYDRCGQI